MKIYALDATPNIYGDWTYHAEPTAKTMPLDCKQWLADKVIRYLKETHRYQLPRADVHETSDGVLLVLERKTGRPILAIGKPQCTQ
jgi:hypothetical protein